MRFHQIISENEVWSVLDPSKIQAYLDCPRKYFYEYILGWRRAEGSDLHAEFGTAAHFAMEVLMQDGYTPAACNKAFDAFLHHYRQHFTPDQDELNKPKTPENMLRALWQYCLRYIEVDSKDETLHVEVSGTVPLAPDKVIHFKMDTIRRGPQQGYYSLEHKTSSKWSLLWEADWRQKVQTGAYNHVLYCLFPQAEVYGVIINGIFLHEPPRIKKNGEPYAGEKDNDFKRVPVRMSPEQMEGWRLDVLSYIWDIERDMARLQMTDEGDMQMPAFRRNRQSCTRYGVCPYLDICSTTQNPVQLVSRPVPAAFEVRHWDPRSIPTVKERITLS